MVSNFTCSSNRPNILGISQTHFLNGKCATGSYAKCENNSKTHATFGEEEEEEREKDKQRQRETERESLASSHPPLPLPPHANLLNLFYQHVCFL